MVGPGGTAGTVGAAVHAVVHALVDAAAGRADTRVANQMLGRIKAAPIAWWACGGSLNSTQADNAAYTGPRYSTSAVRAAPALEA